MPSTSNHQIDQLNQLNRDLFEVKKKQKQTKRESAILPSGAVKVTHASGGTPQTKTPYDEGVYTANDYLNNKVDIVPSSVDRNNSLAKSIKGRNSEQLGKPPLTRGRLSKTGEYKVIAAIDHKAAAQKLEKLVSE